MCMFWEYHIIKQIIKEQMDFEQDIFMDEPLCHSQKIDVFSTGAAKSGFILSGDSWMNQFLMSPFGQMSDLALNHQANQEPLKMLAQLEMEFPSVQEMLFPDEQSPEENQMSVTEQINGNRNKSDEKKNFLTCAKRCIINLVGEELSKIKSQVVAGFLKDKSKTNKLEFQKLFKDEGARVILEQIFISDALYQEIQLSMMRKGYRKVFLNLLNFLKKAFIERRLPNL